MDSEGQKNKASGTNWKTLLRHPKVRSSVQSAFQTIIALLIAVVIGAILIIIIGENPLEAFAALFKGSFGNWASIARTLRMASPVLMTGLAVNIAFRAGFIFLGMEGSLYWGALAAALTGIYLSPYLPTFLHLPSTLLACALAGGIWALIPAIAKAKWRIDEIVSSLMLNYIAIILVDHLVYSFFQDPSKGTQANRAVTLTIPETARLPFISEEYDLSYGIAIGVILVIILAIVFSRSVWGYEVFMTGLNRRFAKSGGVNVSAIAISSIVVAGVISGLGGGTEVLGSYGRYIGGFSTGLGFDGVTVALMGRLSPVGTLLGAVFLGALKNGSAYMELSTNIPRDMVIVLEGLILLIITANTIRVMVRTNKNRDAEA